MTDIMMIINFFSAGLLDFWHIMQRSRSRISPYRDEYAVPSKWQRDFLKIQKADSNLEIDASTFYFIVDY
jgi:hypothetical protein